MAETAPTTEVVDPEKMLAQAESSALLNDVRAAGETVVRAWGKVHNPRKSRLSEGQHMIVVLQGSMTAVAEQAARLAAANPTADPAWLRNALIGQFDMVWQANLAPAEPAKAS